MCYCFSKSKTVVLKLWVRQLGLKKWSESNIKKTKVRENTQLKSFLLLCVTFNRVIFYFNLVFIVEVLTKKSKVWSVNFFRFLNVNFCFGLWCSNKAEQKSKNHGGGETETFIKVSKAKVIFVCRVVPLIQQSQSFINYSSIYKLISYQFV